jgi:L-alanine-DL-glutamate epimerase-like enolase superfamily enzyme
VTLEAHVVEIALARPWTIARGTTTGKRVAVVELRHERRVGLGEASPVSRYGESLDSVLAAVPAIGAALEGRDVRAYRAVAAAIAGAVAGERAAKAAVDAAVHDLAARALGVPLYRLLGVEPARMPETSYSVGIDEPAKMAEKVREGDAFAVLKVKLGTEDDRALFRAVRAATDKRIRVDANEAWRDPEAALSLVRELAADGVELVEQPLPAADLDGARWLAARSPIPIVADEAMSTAEDVPRLAGAYHGANVKLQKTGGIDEALRTLAALRAHGMKAMIGCMIETSLGIAAAAHIAPLFDWVDLDGNLLLANDPFEGHPVVGGRICLGDAPGLGVTLRR